MKYRPSLVSVAGMPCTQPSTQHDIHTTTPSFELRTCHESSRGHRVWYVASIIAAFFATALPSGAAVIAYDTFDYVSGGLSGSIGGDGFSNAWSVSGAGTVTATDGSAFIQPTGGTTYALRTLSTSVNENDFTDVYISMSLARTMGTRFVGMELRNSSNAIVGYLGIQAGTVLWGLGAGQFGSLVSDSGGRAVTEGEFALLVLHLQFGATAADPDIARLYVDPGTMLPDTPNLIYSEIGNNSFDRIALGAGFNSGVQTTANGLFSDVRFATTWAEAVPEPGQTSLLMAGLMAIVMRRMRRTTGHA